MAEKPGVDADVRNNHAEVLGRHDAAESGLRPWRFRSSVTSSRVPGGSLHIDDELSRIGARKE